MVAKLTQLQKPNYKYQKDNNYIIITGVFLTEEEAKIWVMILVLMVLLVLLNKKNLHLILKKNRATGL
ncbi:hypothetical protein SD457_14245 [Coprobacillaceae bacterium CR2/5/TPMF4]|nr:hypothetical protein SD457_14245 [Coprobacillaceae bacterium CR2/5/TPMF4]